VLITQNAFPDTSAADTVVMNFSIPHGPFPAGTYVCILCVGGEGGTPTVGEGLGWNQDGDASRISSIKIDLGGVNVNPSSGSPIRNVFGYYTMASQERTELLDTRGGPACGGTYGASCADVFYDRSEAPVSILLNGAGTARPVIRDFNMAGEANSACSSCYGIVFEGSNSLVQVTQGSCAEQPVIEISNVVSNVPQFTVINNGGSGCSTGGGTSCQVTPPPVSLAVSGTVLTPQRSPLTVGCTPNLTASGVFDTSPFTLTHAAQFSPSFYTGGPEFEDVNIDPGFQFRNGVWIEGANNAEIFKVHCLDLSEYCVSFGANTTNTVPTAALTYSGIIRNVDANASTMGALHLGLGIDNGQFVSALTSGATNILVDDKNGVTLAVNVYGPSLNQYNPRGAAPVFGGVGLQNGNAPIALNVVGGTGGEANPNTTGNGNTGGGISLSAGAGSSGGSTSGIGGPGGNISLTAGNGGAATSGSTGAGGNIVLSAGATGAPGTAGLGGSVQIVGPILTGPSSPFLSVTGTWQDSPVSFDAGILENVTDNGSATGSLLIDLQTGSASMFTVNKAGLTITNTLNLTNPLMPAYGGTGVASPTGHAIAIAEGVSNFHFVGPGNVGAPLLSGSAADPAFGALNLSGGSNIVSGTLPATNVANIPLNQVISPVGSVATFANMNLPLVFNWAQTTPSQSAITFGEATAPTSSGNIEVNIQTAATSTTLPIQITASGVTNGWNMSASGLWEPLSTGGALALGGTAHSLAISEGPSTQLNLLTSPTTNGNCVVSFNVTTGTAVDPHCALQGIPVNAPSTPYTLVYSDRNSYIKESGGSTATLNLPQVIGNTAANFPFVTQNLNPGNLTITANATDKIDNGGLGGSATLLPAFAAWVYQDSSSAPGNWWTIKVPTFAAFPACSTALQLLPGGFSCPTGISGGIPYFSATNLFSSSALLSANGVMIGGGTSAAPSTITVDTTATHALFATSSAPAFRAIAFGDLPTITLDEIGSAASAVTWNNSTNAITVNNTSAVTQAFANITFATSALSQSSPLLSLSGNYWNGTASATDSWTIENSIANGTNGTASLAFAHAGSSSAQVNLFAGKLVIDGTGTFKNISNLTTAGLGVPITQGTPVNQTGQNTSLGTTNILASAPAAGAYTIHYYADQNATCNTAPTVFVTFNWTDVTHARQFQTPTLTLQNAQGTALFTQGTLTIWAAASTAITLTTTIGGSFGACTYDLHAWVDEAQ
jgi:hypothetical protein